MAFQNCTSQVYIGLSIVNSSLSHGDILQILKHEAPKSISRLATKLKSIFKKEHRDRKDGERVCCVPGIHLSKKKCTATFTKLTGSSCKDTVCRHELEYASQTSHCEADFLRRSCSLLYPYHLVTPFAKCRCQNWVQILANGLANALRRGNIAFLPFLLPFCVLGVHILSPSNGIPL